MTSEAELYMGYRHTKGADMTATVDAEAHTFEFPPSLDPGTYVASFLGCREFSYVDKATKEDVTLLSWSFEVLPPGEEEFAVVEGVTSLLLTPRSKGFAWLRAIAPEVVKERRMVSSLELAGAKCLVVIEEKDEEARVADVMPPLDKKATK